MQRDLASLAKARVSAVLVELSPSAIMREEIRSRLWHFGELASKSQVRVALLLVPDAPGELKMRRANVLRFLETQKFGALPGALRQSDRVVVVLSERMCVSVSLTAFFAVWHPAASRSSKASSAIVVAFLMWLPPL